MADLPKEYQFERLIRLIGPEDYAKLQRSHILIMGCGGVGSWATEALARMDIGRFTLVDFDIVRPSNINRQLIATPRQLGRLKCEVMRERILEINPEAKVECIPVKYLPDNSQQIWEHIHPDAIVDAIDNITAKCHLLAEARRRNIPIVTSTGAAGRLNPSLVKITDLSHTKVDPVALQVRKKLRRDYCYPANKSFHIPAVYSEELPIKPIETAELTSLAGQGNAPFVDSDPDEERPRRHAPPYGTSSFVVGTFGLFVAGKITELLLQADI